MATASIKGLIQSMQTDSAELLQGTVIQTSPIKIQITNDEKLIINSRITTIPWHLTNYETTCTLEDIGTKNITINNALSKGDSVYVLSINNGKLYIVLDRVG